MARLEAVENQTIHSDLEGLEKGQARSTQGVCFLARPGSSLHQELRMQDELSTLQEDRLVVEEATERAKTEDLVMVVGKGVEAEKEAAEKKEG